MDMNYMISLAQLANTGRMAEIEMYSVFQIQDPSAKVGKIHSLAVKDAIPPSGTLSGTLFTPFSALYHYMFGGGTALNIDIDRLKIDANIWNMRGVSDTIETMREQNAHSQNISIVWDHNTGQDSTVVGSYMGYVQLRLDGILRREANGSYTVEGNIVSNKPDIYDANPSNHRGAMAEWSTAILGSLPGTAYQININGSLSVHLNTASGGSHQRQAPQNNNMGEQSTEPTLPQDAVVYQLDKAGVRVPYLDSNPDVEAFSIASAPVFYSGRVSFLSGTSSNFDLARMSGHRLSFDIYAVSEESVIMRRNDGAFFTFSGVERFEFADGIIDTANVSRLSSLSYIASNMDLAGPLGSNPIDALIHMLAHGVNEGRSLLKFDGIQYIASHGDLTSYFSGRYDVHNVIDAGAVHYIHYGHAEGRLQDSFNSWGYLASNPLLYQPLQEGGWAEVTLDDALAFHWVANGKAEGRQRDAFNEWSYLASNPGLVAELAPIWTSLPLEQKAERHFGTYGAMEGRAPDSFNEWDYLAANPDLTRALDRKGWEIYDMPTAAAKHYALLGFFEGRGVPDFDAHSYFAANPGLAQALAAELYLPFYSGLTMEDAAAKHYAFSGYYEGRPLG